jgi:hypothetical protein
MAKPETVDIQIIGKENTARLLLNALKKEDPELLDSLALNGYRYIHFQEVGGDEAVGVFRPPSWDGGKMGRITETGRVARVNVAGSGSFRTVLESAIGLDNMIIKSSVVIFAPGDQSLRTERDGVTAIGRRVNDAVGLWRGDRRIGFKVDARSGLAVTDVNQGLFDNRGNHVVNAYGFGDKVGSVPPEVAAAVIASQLGQRYREGLARAG